MNALACVEMSLPRVTSCAVDDFRRLVELPLDACLVKEFLLDFDDEDAPDELDVFVVSIVFAGVDLLQN